MRYTESELRAMPISILRGVDIQNADDEKLVQKILNTRLRDMPSIKPMNFPASVTDNMTIEKERELQKKIDDRTARLKAQLVSADEDVEEESPSTEINEDEEIPLMPDAEDVPVVEPENPQPITEGTPEPVLVVDGKFCDYCDSLGVRHKKICTRPDKPLE